MLSKTVHDVCYDELICCAEPKSHFEVCCNPPEYKAWST
ncbi:hypothetical protein BpHYR1_014163, partial [Brachionus plicatilis]